MPNPQSPELLTTAMDQLTQGVMITDARLDRPGPVIVYVNPAWETLTGYSAEEAIGETPRLLQGPETSREVLDKLRTDLATSGHADAETVNYQRDGTPFVMAWSVSPLRQDDGAISHFVAIQRDVTESRNERAQLQRLEALSRIQEEVAFGGLDVTELERRVTEVAQEVTGADGAALEEADEGQMVYRAVAGAAEGYLGLRLPMATSLSGQVFRSQEAVLCTDSDTDDRVTLKAKAREVGFRSAVLVPLRHHNRPFGVLKVFADQPGRFSEHERHLLELASGTLAAGLAKAHDYTTEIDRRGLLLDAIPALISYVDSGMRYREVNAAYEELFGKSAEAIRGQAVVDLLGREGFERIRAYLDAALRGERVRYENDVPFADGEIRTMAGDYLPHIGRDGTVYGLYAIVRDITEARRAQTDYLTGLMNRRELQRQAEQQLAIAQRHNQPLCLVMADIDHFKAINDQLGHLTGDDVLRGFADRIREAMRDADMAGRWGGEEFVLLLPETDAEGGAQLAERLRASVASHDLVANRQVTASFGVAAMGPEDSLQSLQERADRAMYEAKKAGRNRVKVAPLA